MKNHSYAATILSEKIEELEKKKGEDKDVNDGLDALIRLLSDSIQTLHGQDY